MPIVYNAENKAWEGVDLTENEKQSLINIAVGMISDSFGEEIADRMMQHFRQNMTLTDLPKEAMGNA
jgi:hypothetical protein